MKKWIWLALAIVTEVTASLSLKGALDQPLWYAVVALGYSAAFVFLSLTLREGMGLGVAYGIWGALGVALTAVFAMLLFGEPLTSVMVVGLVLIILGVLTVELGSQQAHKKRALREESRV